MLVDPQKIVEKRKKGWNEWVDSKDCGEGKGWNERVGAVSLTAHMGSALDKQSAHQKATQVGLRRIGDKERKCHSVPNHVNDVQIVP